MKTDKKILNKIEHLNVSYISIRKALKTIKKLFPKDNSINHILWKVDKELAKLHKCILKLLEHEIVEDDFNKVIKNF